MGDSLALSIIIGSIEIIICVLIIKLRDKKDEKATKIGEL